MPFIGDIKCCLLQANQGVGTVRAVVETILRFVLPAELAQYSLTGKSLQAGSIFCQT